MEEFTRTYLMYCVPASLLLATVLALLLARRYRGREAIIVSATAVCLAAVGSFLVFRGNLKYPVEWQRTVTLDETAVDLEYQPGSGLMARTSVRTSQILGVVPGCPPEEILDSCYQSPEDEAEKPAYIQEITPSWQFPKPPGQPSFQEFFHVTCPGWGGWEVGYAAYLNGEIWCAQHYTMYDIAGGWQAILLFTNAFFMGFEALAVIVAALAIAGVVVLEIRLRRKRKANGTELVSKEQ